MAKLQSNHRFYKPDIKPDINHSDTNYNTTTLTWSKLKTKRKEKLHTATVVLPFQKYMYIHYNTPTRAITDLSHLILGLGDYKCDIARVGVL